MTPNQSTTRLPLDVGKQGMRFPLVDRWCLCDCFCLALCCCLSSSGCTKSLNCMPSVVCQAFTGVAVLCAAFIKCHARNHSSSNLQGIDSILVLPLPFRIISFTLSGSHLDSIVARCEEEINSLQEIDSLVFTSVTNENKTYKEVSKMYMGAEGRDSMDKRIYKFSGSHETQPMLSFLPLYRTLQPTSDALVLNGLQFLRLLQDLSPYPWLEFRDEGEFSCHPIYISANSILLKAAYKKDF